MAHRPKNEPLFIALEGTDGAPDALVCQRHHGGRMARRPVDFDLAAACQIRAGGSQILFADLEIIAHPGPGDAEKAVPSAASYSARMIFSRYAFRSPRDAMAAISSEEKCPLPNAG